MLGMSLSDLSARAAQQHGLMTREQVTKAINPMRLSRLVKAKSWEVVRPGVYRKAAKSTTEAQELMAVHLWSERTAVASHSSAGRLLGLDLERKELEFSVSKFSGELPGVTLHRAKRLDHKDDCRDYKGILITDGARTVIDLATRLKEEDAAILVEEAWRRRVAPPQWVEKKLKAMKPRPRGGSMLLEILADCATRKSALESALEVRVWRLLKKNGFTGMVANQPYSDDYGQPGRIDIAFVEQSLAIECDGWESHGTREAFDKDRKRTQRLLALGWRVMPITWKHLTDEPAKVVQRVREALAYRVTRRAR